jgi:hypothetical protein
MLPLPALMLAAVLSSIQLDSVVDITEPMDSSELKECTKSLFLYCVEDFSGFGAGNQINSLIAAREAAADLDMLFVPLGHSSLGCPPDWTGPPTLECLVDLPPPGCKVPELSDLQAGKELVHPTLKIASGEVRRCGLQEQSRYCGGCPREGPDYDERCSLQPKTMKGVGAVCVGGDGMLRSYFHSREAVHQDPGWMGNVGIPADVAKELAAARWWDGAAFAKYIVPFALKFRPPVQADIRALVGKVGLPASYASIHIRRGDKLYHEMKETVGLFWEAERAKERGVDESQFVVELGGQTLAYVPLYAYIELVQELQKKVGSKLADVFIATDDYHTVHVELSRLPSGIPLPKYRYVFNENMKLGEGKQPAHIDSAPAQSKYAMFLNFMADVQLLAGAEVFVGSMDSNVDRLAQSCRFANGFSKDSYASISPHEWQNAGV